MTEVPSSENAAQPVTPTTRTHSIHDVIDYLLDQIYHLLDLVEGGDASNTSNDPVDAGPDNSLNQSGD